MALTQDETERVTAILDEHPDMRTQDVLREAELPQKQLFAVKSLRNRLGVPEPDDGRPRGKPGRKPKAQSETLEADSGGPASEPSGPKRRGGPSKAPQSIAAPILPRMAHAAVVGIQQLTHNLTHGTAPMTAAEATAIAVPAVRIADRTLAKYVKKTGKVTPNQEDAALIAVTVLAWLIGWIVASVTKAPRTAPGVHVPTQRTRQPAATDAPDDLFTGSEPLAQHAAPAASPIAASSPVSGHDAGDAADLFSGSEPLAPGVAASPVQHAPRPIDPARARASEATWQALMPTDMGEALAG